MNKQINPLDVLKPCDHDEDPRVECGDCDWAGKESETKEIQDLGQRVDAGAEFPAGACPECGSLAWIIEEDNVYAFEVRQLRAQRDQLVEACKTLLAIVHAQAACVDSKFDNGIAQAQAALEKAGAK